MQMCIVGVVVTNKSKMALYFPKAGNLKGSNADMCSDVAGLSSSSSSNLFVLSDGSNKTDTEYLNWVIHYWPPTWI